MTPVLKSSAENPVQLDDFCRLCLLQKPNLRPLSSQNQAMMIPEMYFRVTGTLLNMYEQLPRVVCERCVVKLELAYNIAEEFRQQEELLRRLWWKGALVDQLVVYQQESRRKPHSEVAIERLASLREELETNDDNQLQIIKSESLDATEFSIDVVEQSYGKNEIIDNRLEMVLELEDLRTIGALPDKLLEQLDAQQISNNVPEETFSGAHSIRSSTESMEEETTHDNDTVYFPDKIEYEDNGERHIISKTGLFQCPDCGKSYGMRTFLQRHQRKVHNRFIGPDEKTTEPAPTEEIRIRLGTLAEGLVSDAYQKPSIDDKIEDSDEDCLLVQDGTTNKSSMVLPAISVQPNETSNVTPKVTYKWEMNRNANPPFYELKEYRDGNPTS